MKLYIIGSVASGKTTLARRISARTGIPCHHLDEVVHIPDPTDREWGNRKRPAGERDALFAEILESQSYVMEDAGREYFQEGLRRADTILLLDIPLGVRRRRIVFRWIKQNLGLEQCIYRPGFGMLRSMFHWAKDFDLGTDGVRDRLLEFAPKTVVLHGEKEAAAYVQQL